MLTNGAVASNGNGCFDRLAAEAQAGDVVKLTTCQGGQAAQLWSVKTAGNFAWNVSSYIQLKNTDLCLTAPR
jgi:hypothetical protein